MSHEPRDYFRSTVVISSITLVSRLLGVVRDVVCAGYFGAGVVWDAFSFAFRIPNLFRKFFGEGALNAALIPVLTEYLELRGRRDACRLAGVVFTAVGAVLLACLLLGESITFIIPRAAALSGSWRLALALTAVMLPHMVFICLAAVAAGALNSIKHFAMPALAPSVLNVLWIIAVVIVAPAVSAEPAERAFVLGAAIVVAGVFEFLLQLETLRRKGFHCELAFDLKDPGLRRIALAMTPIVIGLAAVEVNMLMDGVIAISLSAPENRETFTVFGVTIRYPMLVGANSVLYYGNRLMQFPLGTFGIALATAVFPTLSARAARRDWDGFGEALTDGLGAVIFIGLPAGAGLIMLCHPTVELLFERGAFGADTSARTASVLAAYSTGIWAYCALHVLARAFYSLQDTRTPVKAAVAMAALNLALNLILIWFLRETGLALATAVSAVAQSIILYVILTRRVQLKHQSRLLATLLKTCVATAVMAGVVAAVLQMVPPAPQKDVLTVKALRLLAPMTAGLVAFFGVAAALQVREMRLLIGALARRLRRSR